MGNSQGPLWRIYTANEAQPGRFKRPPPPSSRPVPSRTGICTQNRPELALSWWFNSVRELGLAAGACGKSGTSRWPRLWSGSTQTSRLKLPAIPVPSGTGICTQNRPELALTGTKTGPRAQRSGGGCCPGPPEGIWGAGTGIHRKWPVWSLA